MIDVTELPIVSDVMPLQPENAYDPIEVTELGIVSVPVRLLQPENAVDPIDVTELGIVSVPVRPLNSWKAYAGIFVTLLPMFSVVTEVHPEKQVPEPISVQLVALKFTVLSPLQFLKAKPPMEVMGLGMVMEVMSLQP